MPLGLSPLHFLLVFGTLAIPLAFLALLVQAVRSRPPDPRAVLADRLARGEITREQFDTAMAALGYGPDAPSRPGWGDPGARRGP